MFYVDNWDRQQTLAIQINLIVIGIRKILLKKLYLIY